MTSLTYLICHCFGNNFFYIPEYEQLNRSKEQSPYLLVYKFSDPGWRNNFGATDDSGPELNLLFWEETQSL